MIMVRLSAMRTFQIPPPHSVDQLEPYISQSEDYDTCDSRRDCGVHVHYEDEIVDVDQSTRPLSKHERGVDKHVDRNWRAYAVL